MEVSRLEEIVCSECGERQCWEGTLMCTEAVSASIMPRWRWEMREAQERLAWLLARTGWATDGTLLQAVGLLERYAREQNALVYGDKS